MASSAAAARSAPRPEKELVFSQRPPLKPTKNVALMSMIESDSRFAATLDGDKHRATLGDGARQTGPTSQVGRQCVKGEACVKQMSLRIARLKARPSFRPVVELEHDERSV